MLIDSGNWLGQLWGFIIVKMRLQDVRDETYKFYPNAKLAHLKTGGNFPYLSRTEEINMFLLIHLRNFETAVA